MGVAGMIKPQERIIHGLGPGGWIGQGEVVWGRWKRTGVLQAEGKGAGNIDWVLQERKQKWTTALGFERAGQSYLCNATQKTVYISNPSR